MARPRKKQTKKEPRPGKPPSVLGILQTDYASVLCVIAPLVGLGLWFLADVVGVFTPDRPGSTADPGNFFLGLGAAALGICGPLLGWRVRRLLQLLREGAQVPGRITDVSFSQDRGTVAFSYEYEGEEYVALRALSKTRRTRQLEEGQSVTVVLDPSAPRRALVRDLYGPGPVSPFFPLAVITLVFLVGVATWKTIAERVRDAPPPAAEPTLDELRAELKTGVPERQLRALHGLKRLGPQAAPAIPDVVGFLREGTREMRALAAETLGAVGPQPEVLKALRDAAANERMPPVQEAISRALKQLEAATPPQ